MKDLISVIVPVYNAEKYIRKCVASIQEQSYSHFELILINDGSKDNSLALCQEMATLDQRIIVHDRINGGASAARNTGLDIAKGDYIVFVDSDDFVSPDYLKNLYSAAKQGNYDIVQCNLQSTDRSDFRPEKIEFRESDVSEITKGQALNERLYKVTIWGKIYKRYIFDLFHFQEGIIYEDDASYYIFVDRAHRLAVLDETLYYYYMSENSVMRNDKKDKSTAFIGIYEDRIRYFRERNNQELLDGSYDRFCLVLMLSLAASYTHGNNCGDRKQLWTLYKKYYHSTMQAKTIGMKDKLMFTCFRIAPHLVGRIIG
ncbi:glycosyltransferase family 2 protein [Blautia sp. HCP3S3_C4]|uniref:glycosyltransferase family 2 protein n=1 Tax=Blautia sp. HCP3S3_C4 TaxID=3438911 RepID=UPI003F89344A